MLKKRAAKPLELSFRPSRDTKTLSFKFKGLGEWTNLSVITDSPLSFYSTSLTVSPGEHRWALTEEGSRRKTRKVSPIPGDGVLVRLVQNMFKIQLRRLYF